jgi:hypothetical protein
MVVLIAVGIAWIAISKKREERRLRKVMKRA